MTHAVTLKRALAEGNGATHPTDVSWCLEASFSSPAGTIAQGCRCPRRSQIPAARAQGGGSPRPDRRGGPGFEASPSVVGDDDLCPDGKPVVEKGHHVVG